MKRVVLCGGYGLWQLLDARRGAVAAWNGNWLDALFLLVFPLAVAAPLLAVAYICLRRQYPKLFLVSRSDWLRRSILRVVCLT